MYAIENNKALARFVLPDGDGSDEKVSFLSSLLLRAPAHRFGFSLQGFKSEWATVKDDQLFVGSFGKEWSTDAGEILNHNPQWIKVIDK